MAVKTWVPSGLLGVCDLDRHIKMARGRTHEDLLFLPCSRNRHVTTALFGLGNARLMGDGLRARTWPAPLQPDRAFRARLEQPQASRRQASAQLQPSRLIGGVVSRCFGHRRDASSRPLRRICLSGRSDPRIGFRQRRELFRRVASLLASFVTVKLRYLHGSPGGRRGGILSRIIGRNASIGPFSRSFASAGFTID